MGRSADAPRLMQACTFLTGGSDGGLNVARNRLTRGPRTPPWGGVLAHPAPWRRVRSSREVRTGDFMVSHNHTWPVF
eukprot:2754869-Prymnesium_polylepis.2